MRRERLTPVMTALSALDVTTLPFPVDTAVRLAQLRVMTGLRLPDCCVLLTTEQVAGRCASFDEGLASAAEARGLVVFRS